MNNAVEPIFNIFKYMNSTATVCEQCYYSLYTLNSCDFTVHALRKKKMLKLKRAKCAIQTNTNSSVFTSSFGPFTEPKPTSIQLFKQNLETQTCFCFQKQ